MTFSTKFEFLNHDDNSELDIPREFIDFGTATANVDLVGLPNGGFVGIGDAAGAISGTMYDAEGGLTHTFTAGGTKGAIARLSSGDLIVASQDAGSILYKIVDGATGADAAGTVDTKLTNSSNVDVTALAGGASVISFETNFGGTDNDIRFLLVDSGGKSGSGVSIDTSQANDSDASIAALANGNFVTSWTRTIGAQTEIWYAINRADGSFKLGPTLFDTQGSVNRDVSATALKGGGFAFAYEDNENPGGISITLATFDKNGGNVNKFDVGANSNANPHLTLLANGLLAMGSNEGKDDFVSLIDPTTGITLARRDIITTDIGNDNEHAVPAAFGPGYVIVADNDVTNPDVVGEVLVIQRTSIGDVFSQNEFVGDDFFDIVVGGDFSDTLSGGNGNDSLSGAGQLDTLNGGAGDDLLEGGFGSDRLDGGSGNDVIFANTIDDPTGSSSPDFMIGSAGNDSITGALGFEQLQGNEGNDTLDGGGGGDTMKGGAGNDLYIVESTFDVVTDFGGGIDSVQSALTFTLSKALENLTLTGNAAINGTGNGSANILVGNAAGNKLIGGGGADTINGGGGNDTMQGNVGNDTYIVDDNLGKIIEIATGGKDTVKASVSFALGFALENLELTGAAPINGQGNGLGNDLIGNDAINVLNGLGGADTMAGHGGNDVYVVDSANDKVIEAVDGGNDLIRSTVGYTLSAEVENLALIGTASVAGRGNELNNTLIGNAGDNLLIGFAGNDTMFGQLGADRYRLAGALDAANNVDTIRGYVVADDRIELDHVIFTELSTGVLTKNEFVISSKGATTADQRIIYNPLNGFLIYDTNGNIAGGDTHIANLAHNLAMANTEFFVV